MTDEPYHEKSISQLHERINPIETTLSKHETILESLVQGSKDLTASIERLHQHILSSQRAPYGLIFTALGVLLAGGMYYNSLIMDPVKLRITALEEAEHRIYERTANRFTRIDGDMHLERIHKLELAEAHRRGKEGRDLINGD